MSGRGAVFLTALCIALQLLNSTTGFYLPGMTPVNYCVPELEGPHCQSTIDLFVNRLDSTESILPYEYGAFDFCSETARKRPPEYLGQVLFGERIEPSPYRFEFLKDEVCKPVCTKAYRGGNAADAALLDFLKTGILRNYHHHWIVDNMPVTWCYLRDDGQKICTPGFPIGVYFTEEGQPKGARPGNYDFGDANTFYMFNHVDITIHYHRVEGGRPGSPARLVTARVEPKSYKHDNPDAPDCSGGPMTLGGKHTGDVKIPYTYSVSFVEDKSSSWPSRWDCVLEESGPKNNIHWFSIVNSLAFVLFLSGMVAMAVRRSLHRDIARYNNQTDAEEDLQEHSGWKLVHGDVFRSPRRRMLLSVFLGSGAQIFVMTFATLVFACLGFLSPANRGAVMTCAMVLWVLLGALAGYVAARLYRSFGGERWKTNVLLTSLLCPGLVFADFLLMDLILWAEGSSAAMPFGTLVAVLALWLGVSVPLAFLGAFVGLRRPRVEHPVRTNLIPRQVPWQPPCTRPLPGIVIGGLLPFTCIFIQLFFILNSLWSHQMFYMFGFLFLAFVILAITCSQVTIILCYYHLCAEDYRWQWRSFLTSGFSAVYFLVYMVVYFFCRLRLAGLASAILYFGYAAIVALNFFLITGAVGFFACFWFVTSIYSVIKVD